MMRYSAEQLRRNGYINVVDSATGGIAPGSKGVIVKLPDGTSGSNDKYGLENPVVIDFLRREFFQKSGRGKLGLYIANPWVEENRCMKASAGCDEQAT